MATKETTREREARIRRGDATEEELRDGTRHADETGNWFTQSFRSEKRQRELMEDGMHGGLESDSRAMVGFQDDASRAQRGHEDDRFEAILQELQRYFGQANEYYQKELGLWQPQVGIGNQALHDLADFRGPTADEVRESPDYQFRLEEGERLAQAQQNAAGRSGRSAGAQKELTRFGQDQAQTHWRDLYDREFQRLNTLVGYGQAGLQGQAQAIGNMHGVNANVMSLGANNVTNRAGNLMNIEQNDADARVAALSGQLDREQQQRSDRYQMAGQVVGGVADATTAALT